jgi:glutamate-5-semialdehyde dehydrogenase
VSVVTPLDLSTYCDTVARRAKASTVELARLTADVKNRWLKAAAHALRQHAAQIIAANALDCDAADDYGLTPAAVDRLRLNEKRIDEMAGALEQIAALPDPIGETIEGSVRPNGLEVRKVRVPLGTVFFIYESRPNVTVDAAAICVKSGNAVILRGGKEALHSSKALVAVLNRCAVECGLPAGAIQLVETTDRAAVGHFLKLSQYIDVVVPRGGRGLIERVVEEATMPVIKHFDGNCHVYVDASADLDMALDILVNSKCQRMGVCNACESLLVHRDVAARFLPRVGEEFTKRNLIMHADAAAMKLLPTAVAATEADWSEEYLGPEISVAVVDGLDSAIEHINRYGSHHTDAIVTRDLAAARKFQWDVDSAAVVVNASTRLNDGGELGLGAEIGISTDKIHARGPCGLRELTTYKYLLTGNGQLRQ